jgi:hypothetical protein
MKSQMKRGVLIVFLLILSPIFFYVFQGIYHPYMFLNLTALRDLHPGARYYEFVIRHRAVYGLQQKSPASQQGFGC